MKKNDPIVHIYVERFPFFVNNEEIFPPARTSEIESCSNVGVRNQKFYVWKLLEKALMCSFGLELPNLDFTRTENGQWVCNQCYFSLSHSDNFVAVAVSNNPIGVDIERRNVARFTDALAKKIVTNQEMEEVGTLAVEARGEAVNALWTKKEAIFKMLGNKSFQPTAIETGNYTTLTKLLQHQDGQYYLTVASALANNAIFRTADQLEFVDCSSHTARPLSAFGTYTHTQKLCCTAVNMPNGCNFLYM